MASSQVISRTFLFTVAVTLAPSVVPEVKVLFTSVLDPLNRSSLKVTFKYGVDSDVGAIVFFIRKK